MIEMCVDGDFDNNYSSLIILGQSRIVGQGHRQAGTFWGVLNVSEPKRHVTNAGPQLTSFDPKSVMSRTRGPNRPFRCLNNIDNFSILITGSG